MIEHKGAEDDAPGEHTPNLAELREINEGLLIAARREQQLATILEAERARLAVILDGIGDGVLVVDGAGMPRRTNKAYERITGGANLLLVPEDGQGQPLPASETPQARAARGETFSLEFTVMAADGKRRWYQANGQPLHDDGAGRAVIVIRDSTERKQLEDLLLHQALHDSLTGLPNHGTLVEALSLDLARSRRFNRPCAVLFLDIDHFKAINDTCGHPDGDAVLRAFTTIVRASLRAADAFGRWGGEEFVAILPETGLEGATLMAERLRIAVAGHSFPAGGGRHVTCSIGVAVFPNDAQSLDDLIGAADRALYAAKRLGRNQVRAANEPTARALAHMAVVSESLEYRVLVGTIEALAAMVQARDRYIGEHNQQVAELALWLAVALQLDAPQARLVEVTGHLHDVGKVAVPDAVLQKPGPLNAAEWVLIHAHCATGAEVIHYIPTLRPVEPLIRAHHEHWDGSGYPEGLAGEAIPLGARIVAVADTFCAMTTDRPYRAACSPLLALAELRRYAGTQFDPGVVTALERMLAPSSGPKADETMPPA